VIAFAVLGEAIPPMAWPGMAIAAAGLYLVMRRRPGAID
jgi:drug/metabolite transporter (DMT)-like permease